MAAFIAPAPVVEPPVSHLQLDSTPLTPRQFPSPDAHADITTDSPTTPTRHSFAGLVGQRPLPDQPVTSPISLGAVVRSHLKDLDDDVDMAEADGETAIDDEGSDNESVTSDSQRPSKKKKGQRFFCTDFPPCQLSFTRSEHLARHIRKHTGERPFQCHCSRRFSRLDNLRQHAQTVHVNEDIPGDSLAATSTRFQRQVRTDRVRPTANRSRASTATSAQGTPRHSRNLSTSSIASTTSTFSISDEIRRRQPVLAMAENNKRSAGMIDEYSQPSYEQYSGMNTPTSQVYQIGSPSGYNSPSQRSSYHAGHRHIRRLSVPSSSNPYQSNPYASGQYTPTSTHSTLYSGTPSGYASPTSSVFSQGRYENESEIEYRRRTWHPNTQSSYAQRPATSGLSYHQTPDEERPALSQQPAATQLTRLPGIESFDHAPPPSSRQPMSPNMDYSQRPIDHALHQGLHRLDITASSPQESRNDPSPQERSLPALNRMVPAPLNVQPVNHMHHMSMPEPSTPRRNKRQGWYGGPVAPSPGMLQPGFSSQLRSSPEDSGSSDGIATPAVGPLHEHHPHIVNHNDPHMHHHMVIDQQPGFAQHEHMHKPSLPPRADSGFQSYPHPPPRPPPTAALPPIPYPIRLQAGHDPAKVQAPAYQHSMPPPNDMGRLEALVAVATGDMRADESRS